MYPLVAGKTDAVVQAIPLYNSALLTETLDGLILPPAAIAAL
jgi:hypothetical protein